MNEHLIQMNETTAILSSEIHRIDIVSKSIMVPRNNNVREYTDALTALDIMEQRLKHPRFIWRLNPDIRAKVQHIVLLRSKITEARAMVPTKEGYCIPSDDASFLKEYLYAYIDVLHVYCPRVKTDRGYLEGQYLYRDSELAWKEAYAMYGVVPLRASSSTKSKKKGK